MGSYRTALARLLLAAAVILTCSDSDKSVEPQVDKSVPAQISDLSVDFNDQHSVLLSWSAVGDDGHIGEVSVYEVCWSNNYALVQSMDSTAHLVGNQLSSSPGEAISLEVMVGDTSAILFFSARAVDNAGNRGEVSNIAMLNSFYLGQPEAIDDLHAECLPANRMKLVWTSPAIEVSEVPAAAYDIRVSQSEITEENFYDADPVPNIPQPSPAGATEELVVENLTAGNTFYFGIRATGYDEELFSYSNFISSNCFDDTAPATVDDFEVVYVNATDITLGWTAVGDDGSIGTAAFYRLRVSPDSITEANWSAATIVSGLAAPKATGETERFDVPYGPDDATLYFGLKVFDEVGNSSGLATAKFQNEAPPENLIWTRNYDIGGDERATCAIEISDGLIVAGTTVSESTEGVDIFVIKLDSYGELRWSRTFGGVGDDYAVGVTAGLSGNIVIGGYSSSTTGGDKDPYFLEISSGGDFVGESYDHYPGNETIVDFAQTSDGGYVLVGSSTSSTDSTLSYYTNSFMAKYTSNYTRAFYSLFTGHSACDDYTGYADGIAVAGSPNGYFIQGYNIRNYEPWGHTMCGPALDACTFRFISNDGPVLEWYRVGGDGFDTGYMHWLLTSNHTPGTIAIYSTSYSSYFFVCKVNEQFEILSDNPLQVPEIGGLYDAIWAPEGILIARSYGSFDEVLKFAEDGSYLSGIDLGSEYSLELASLARTEAGNIIVTGRIKPGTTDWDAYIALIDPDF